MHLRRKAWHLIENRHPGLVIAEVNLSKLNGTELVWSMKLNPFLSSIPVVLMGSLNREGEALSSGCTAFVAKPFYVDAFMELLRSLSAAETGG